MSKRLPPAPPGYRYIFRASRRCPRTGEIQYAHAYGLRGWPILVPV